MQALALWPLLGYSRTNASPVLPPPAAAAHDVPRREPLQRPALVCALHACRSLKHYAHLVLPFNAVPPPSCSCAS